MVTTPLNTKESNVELHEYDEIIRTLVRVAAHGQNALWADSGNVRAVLRDQLVVRLRRRCLV